MADEFKLTKEIMENADTYIPVITKELLANVIARSCVQTTDLIRPMGDKPEGDDILQVEPVYCESVSTKARYLMTILLTYYLKIRDESAWLLCEIDEYDNWAGAHIINQIERFKAGDYREKAFDILTDYREMEKYINAAIYAVLKEMNDPAKRAFQMIQSAFSADTINEAVEQMREYSEKLEEEKERQEKIVHGEAGEENADG